MIDLHIVGALVRGDLSDYELEAQDVVTLAANRAATDLYRAYADGSRDLGIEAFANALGAVGPTDATSPAWISRDGLAHLIQARRAAVVQSLRQTFTANRTAEILAEAEVPALVYKGVAMAVELNGDWRGRQSSDLDVLIAPHSIDAAHEALVAAGLRRRGSSAKPPNRFNRFRAFEAPYIGLPVTVDLHWDLESPGYFAIPFGEMWERRKRFTGDGLEVWAPSTAESLLIAAVHGTRESWRSVRHVMDFAQLAAQIEGQDWRLAAELSTRGPEKSLAIALAVAQQCGAAPLPAQPGNWAQEVARVYLAPVARALSANATTGSVVRRDPREALKRRQLRWRTAPNIKVAADGFLRSVLRQVGYGSKRSWQLPRLEFSRTPV